MVKERTLSNQLADELQPLYASIKRRFFWLGGIVVLQALVGLWIFWRAEGLLAGLLLSPILFFAVADWGRMLQKAPYDVHLVKARRWALLLLAAIPLGPFIAWPLVGLLRDKRLEQQVCSRHPFASTHDAATIMSLAAMRSSFIFLRNLAFVVLVLLILMAIAIPSMSNVQMRTWVAGSALYLLAMVLAFFISSMLGHFFTARITRRRVMGLLLLACLLLPFAPFGTHAGVAALLQVKRLWFKVNAQAKI